MILSIDADAHRLAYAVLDEGTVKCVRTLERADARGRVREGFDSQLTALMRRCGELGIPVYLEGIFCGQNVKGFAALAEVAGEIKRAARLCSVPVETIMPSTWHSEVLGFTKNRKKLETASMAKAAEVAGRDNLTAHESDAICLGLCAQGRETAGLAIG